MAFDGRRVAADRCPSNAAYAAKVGRRVAADRCPPNAAYAAKVGRWAILIDTDLR